MRRFLAVIISMLMLITAFTVAPVTASAAAKTAEQWAAELGVPVQSIVMPSGDKAGILDRRRLRIAQADCDAITFLPGMKYYIDTRIKPSDGLKVIANGATIYSRTNQAGLFSDDQKPGKGKYENTKNVYIEGGTWYHYYYGGKPKRVVTTMKFIHAQGITLKNMKIYSNYSWHLVELIGCKDVLIDGCTMEMVSGSIKPGDEDEAIQLDFASGGANASGVVPDNTPCANVTVTNNTLKFNRGVCTNIRSNGIEKKITYTNITISGNVITTTKGEGIAPARVKNLTVENNILKGSYSKLALRAREISGTIKAPLSIKLATINALKKGATKITGTKDKTGKISLTVNGKIYTYNKTGTTYTINIPALKKGTSVSLVQLSGNGNKYITSKTL